MAWFDVELQEIAARVARAETTVAHGIVPNVSRGPHCRYCPAVPSCPAVHELVRAAAGEPVATAQETLASLTPETATRAYQRLRDVQSALKEVSSALYLFASEHPIALPDGMEYGATRRKTKNIDARIARKVIASWASPEVAEAAYTFETSEAAIKRALRPVYDAQARAAREAKNRGERIARPTIKALTEAVLTKIAESGGLKVTEAISVREHHAKEPPPGATPIASPEIGSGGPRAAVVSGEGEGSEAAP